MLTLLFRLVSLAETPARREGIVMKMAKIQKRYKNEWVPIEYTKLDEELKGDGAPRARVRRAICGV